MQYQKSILEDEISIDYPVNTIQFQGKKYIKVKDYMYDINMVLGKGSYGTVYLGYAIEEGKQTNDLMKVAIKKITIPGTVERKAEINKILKNTESQLFALINFTHNMHIVRLYDFVRSQEEASVYEILEYCNQKDLNSFLKFQRSRHPICQIQIRYYFMQILKGFKDLHAKKFIHRDMKPQNVLVNNGVLKIADFGFADKIQQFGQKRISFAGTVQTAAPQIVLHMPYTDKCDIYSLGTILYWMIFQRYPIKQIITKEDYLQQIIFPLQPQTSVSMKQLIIKMLKIQQSDRIDWVELFAHPLFDQQIILQTFIIKPQKLRNEPIVQRISSLRYTVKKRKIEDTVPDRASVWLAGLINKQYQLDEELQKFHQNVRVRLRFEMGKVEVLKMVSRTLKNYSPQDKNIISLQSSQISFLVSVLLFAVEQLITFSIRKVKQQISFQTPVQIFDYHDLQAIKPSPKYQSIQEQCFSKLKTQQTKHKQILQNKSSLQALCQKYCLQQQVNWVLRPYGIHSKRFQNELKRIIIQLVSLIKPQIVCMQKKSSKQSIILIHHLFILFMRDEIFKRQNEDKVSFNYFFEKQKYNEGEQGYQYLFMKVRDLVQCFKRS